jgi:hypothetical protein
MLHWQARLHLCSSSCVFRFLRFVPSLCVVARKSNTRNRGTRVLPVSGLSHVRSCILLIFDDACVVHKYTLHAHICRLLLDADCLGALATRML